MRLASFASFALLAATISLVACGESDDVGGSDTSSTNAPALPKPAPTTSGGQVSWPSAQAASSCNWTAGQIPCGDTTCDRETQFCAKGAAGIGTSCKNIGGNGTTCPVCAKIVPLAQQTGLCGALSPSCMGDDRIGITISCE